MRLSTDKLLSDLETQLKGIVIVPKLIDQNGITQYVEKKIGEPKMNETGIQSIMFWISSVVNSATVQGNWDFMQFGNFLYRNRRDLAILLSVNSSTWKVDDNYLEFLCDLIMNTLEAFLSRLKDNEERKSYVNTMKISETNTMQPVQRA